MKTTLLFFLSLGMASVAVAQPPADLQQRLDKWIKGQPGGVAVAWVDGEGTAFFQAGRFDREDSPPITPDTQFEIGSITKVFTALLLAESERLGKVSRTDPAAKYLLPLDDPDQATLAKITLLSLSTHTSGLPKLSSNFGLNSNARLDPYAQYDRALLVDALRREGAVAPVGRGVAYSNFGVALLGEALGVAWGTSYAEALRDRVLEPLGMTATTVGLAGQPPPANFPPGHVAGKAVPNWTFQAYAAMGAVRSSIREMAVLLSACLGKAGESLQEAFAATFQPQHARADSDGQIGLGWFITEEGLIWHNGGTAGSRALIAFDPKAGKGIVILANVKLPTEPLGFGLLGAKPSKPKVEKVKGAADYVGRYPLSPEFIITITETNGVLRAQATEQPPFAMRVIAGDRFAIVGVPAEISFERGADGKVAALVLHQNGRDQRVLRGELPPIKEVALPVETLR